MKLPKTSPRIRNSFVEVLQFVDCIFFKIIFVIFRKIFQPVKDNIYVFYWRNSFTDSVPRRKWNLIFLIPVLIR